MVVRCCQNRKSWCLWVEQISSLRSHIHVLGSDCRVFLITSVCFHRSTLVLSTVMLIIMIPLYPIHIDFNLLISSIDLAGCLCYLQKPLVTPVVTLVVTLVVTPVTSTGLSSTRRAILEWPRMVCGTSTFGMWPMWSAAPSCHCPGFWGVIWGVFCKF